MSVKRKKKANDERDIILEHFAEENALTAIDYKFTVPYPYEWVTNI